MQTDRPWVPGLITDTPVHIMGWKGGKPGHTRSCLRVVRGEMDEEAEMVFPNVGRVSTKVRICQRFG